MPRWRGAVGGLLPEMFMKISQTNTGKGLRKSANSAGDQTAAHWLGAGTSLRNSAGLANFHHAAYFVRISRPRGDAKAHEGHKKASRRRL